MDPFLGIVGVVVVVLVAVYAMCEVVRAAIKNGLRTVNTNVDGLSSMMAGSHKTAMSKANTLESAINNSADSTSRKLELINTKITEIVDRMEIAAIEEVGNGTLNDDATDDAAYVAAFYDELLNKHQETGKRASSTLDLDTHEVVLTVRAKG